MKEYEQQARNPEKRSSFFGDVNFSKRNTCPSIMCLKPPFNVDNGVLRDADTRKVKLIPFDLNLTETTVNCRRCAEGKGYVANLDEKIKKLRDAGANFARINIDARCICSENGDVIEDAGIGLFDCLIDLCEKAGIPVLLGLVAFNGTPGRELGYPGSFSWLYEHGMDIWSEGSIEIQERYFGQILVRRNSLNGQYLFEHRNIAAIRIFDDADDILHGVFDFLSPMSSAPAEDFRLANFKKCRHAFLNARRDLMGKSESERGKAFEKHIFMRYAMAIAPALLHAFGNRALFIFSRGQGFEASEPLKTFADRAFTIISNNAFVPFIKEFDNASVKDTAEVLETC